MAEKNRLIKWNLNNGIVFASKFGDLVENRIGNAIENSVLEAPVLEGEPKAKKWYKIPLENGLSGDGSPYHIYFSKGTTDHLCIFLSGGGVAWNEYTAARPVTGGKVASGQPNYYWNNLRPFTQIMNINVGITDLKNPINPFKDWSFVVVTYATGDFHVGDSEFPYKAEDGSEQILHFHGHKNFVEAMKVARKHFPYPDKLLIAGNSAGAFAVPALAGEIVEDYYPHCMDVTLLSDSGLLLYKKWRKTAKHIWQTKEETWKAIHSENITLDWYRALYEKFGNRFRYLYASSVRDYLLSAYYNDIIKKTYKTDKEVQLIFQKQLEEMVNELIRITPAFHFYFYDWEIPPITQGGTVHTSVREITFSSRRIEGVSMARWLEDAVNGSPYSIGMKLL